MNIFIVKNHSFNFPSINYTATLYFNQIENIFKTSSRVTDPFVFNKDTCNFIYDLKREDGSNHTDILGYMSLALSKFLIPQYQNKLRVFL